VAVNVPAIEMTMTGPPALDATGGQPYQKLLDLDRRYDTAPDNEDTASEAWPATCEAFDAARSVPPAAMRHRIADLFEHQSPVLRRSVSGC
jgi:hypothetical protein